LAWKLKLSTIDLARLPLIFLLSRERSFISEAVAWRKSEDDIKTHTTGLRTLFFLLEIAVFICFKIQKINI
jgi:hypothetical protein